jgi:hypothetical protein
VRVSDPALHPAGAARSTSVARRVDDDGGCYVAIFAEPAAEQRARDYGDALRTGRLTPHKAK